MASYGVFLTACGYDYHGPQGRLAFAPKLHPEKFQAAFTTAEGWGSYRQAINARGEFTATVALKWGKLALRTLQIEPPPGFHPGKIELTDLAAQGACGLENQRLVARFPDGLTLQAGQAASLRCQPAI